ncbi:kinesin-like protein KIF22 isoform X1 [Stegostoma tigrinum]|uniref:kinesin-like protein KIF22 isoform X1 n=1 Tax=Stegostoma tigrinum TaxID=3053191 RepID=UPI002870797E|nr:kinesin-like protein KIF22 isoform X1 [Stegostoma tigrinum]
MQSKTSSFPPPPADVQSSRKVAGPHHRRQVQVVVRLRPYQATEDDQQQGPCVRGLDTRSLEIVNWRSRMETMQYNFDAFYSDDASQQEIYVHSVKPILSHILNGQNASVFAYGPTGAGKTHTMLGSAKQPGVVPRSLLDIFRMVREQRDQLGGPSWSFSVTMSYLEIYQEKVLDLLETKHQDLPIREDQDKNIFIPKLTEQPITSFVEFEQFFLPATQRRTTASTKLNCRSSRSHSVLLIKVVKLQREAPFRQLTGKLYLIDLAGSEDNRKTGNEGVRLKESGAINTSLFVLSKVVDALNQGLCRIPYRDSKLTRLLQDSLGGTAHSVMITNIAPEYKHYFNTLTALNFAAKSKLVVNRPFTQETIQPIGICHLKRSNEGVSSSSQHPAKRMKSAESESAEDSEELILSPLLKAGEYDPDAFDSDMLERISNLEKMLQKHGKNGLPLLGTPKEERLQLLKKLEESRLQIEKLEQRQKQLERAISLQETAAEQAMNNNRLGVLHRASVAKQRKQAVVTPLQCLDNGELLKTGNVLVLKRKEKQEMKDCGSDVENELELTVDQELTQKHKDYILNILNNGSLKQLKTLHRVGDKTAKLIVGWREHNGPYSQIEDLEKIGMSSRTVSTFMKANVVSCMVK